MELGPRKFFKFFSLSFVFNVNEIHDETLGNIAVFDTSENGFNSTFLTNYVGDYDTERGSTILTAIVTLILFIKIVNLD